MKYQDLSFSQKLLAKNIFVKFLQRDMQFTESQALQEFARIVVNGRQLLDEYYATKVRRIGATKVLTRLDRWSVIRTLENAIRHSTFES